MTPAFPSTFVSSRPFPWNFDCGIAGRFRIVPRTRIPEHGRKVTKVYGLWGDADDFSEGLNCYGEELRENIQLTQTPFGREWLFDSIEADRKGRRTVYNSFQKWRGHRNRSRFLRAIAGLPWDPTLRGAFWPMTYITCVSAAVVLYDWGAQSGWLPAAFHPIDIPLGGSVPALTSFALSLMLVFRTNSTYARWREARMAWGGLLNRSRDLMRLGMTYMENAEDQEQLKKWIIAFARSLRSHLLEEAEITEELQGILTSRELGALVNSRHRPNFAIQVISEILRSAQMDVAPSIAVNENLTFLADVVGCCERIIRQPIPVEYTRHTTQFLMFWLTLLPIFLVSSYKVWTIPCMAMMSFMLLGIEEIGVQLEEPFSILPLGTICTRIEEGAEAAKQDHGSAKRLLHQKGREIRKVPACYNNAQPTKAKQAPDRKVFGDEEFENEA